MYSPLIIPGTQYMAAAVILSGVLEIIFGIAKLVYFQLLHCLISLVNPYIHILI